MINLIQSPEDILAAQAAAARFFQQAMAETDAQKSHDARRSGERTMALATAYREFLLHMQSDEDCKEIGVGGFPGGIVQECEEAFPLAKIWAWARVEVPGDPPIWYALASGEGEYKHTYIWARFVWEGSL